MSGHHWLSENLSYQGVFETIDHRLVMADRERIGREASPSAAVPIS